jgi:ABC-type lipoprotein export system ATPase subunit
MPTAYTQTTGMLKSMKLLFESVDKHDATLLAVTHDQELLPYFDKVINFNDFLRQETL